MFCCNSHKVQAMIREVLGLTCDIMDRELLALIMGEGRKEVLESGKHPGELCLVVRFPSLPLGSRLISSKVLGEDVYTADGSMSIIREGFFVPPEKHGEIIEILALLTSTAGSA